MIINSEEFQKTIKDTIFFEGVGLHTGSKCCLTLMPAPVDYGIKFNFTTNKKQTLITSNIKNVISTTRGTNLTKDNISIFTVEHLLSVLYALEIDNLTIVRKILEIMGKSEDLIEFVEDRPGHDLRYSLDSTKISNDLNWSTKLSFEEGLKKTIDWYLNNEKLMNNISSITSNPTPWKSSN